MMDHLVRQINQKKIWNPICSSNIIVFIYTCPSSSKIRERMLYSSSKANVITAASIKVIKKVDTRRMD